jgi:predicted DNA-binding transcriptional regulator YafY
LEVSRRTIYRDIETLCAVGVPVYAEPGRDGGLRLVEGYFLPPIALSVGEATSLLIGLVMLDRLRTKPFANDLETAQRKLLAAVPIQLRHTLEQAQDLIGFEAVPQDIFHPERSYPDENVMVAQMDEAAVITVFLQCIFNREMALMEYFSPYSEAPASHLLLPHGIVWDRDHWYLVGKHVNRDEETRLWRTDRVIKISRDAQRVPDQPDFNIDRLLGRKWLDQAIASWAEMSPVVIRMTAIQAARLKRDWYYSHAHFEDMPTGEVTMTFGESNRGFVFELLRWLGPGAELIEPKAWRKLFVEEVQTMLAPYSE